MNRRRRWNGGRMSSSDLGPRGRDLVVSAILVLGETGLTATQRTWI